MDSNPKSDLGQKRLELSHRVPNENPSHQTAGGVLVVWDTEKSTRRGKTWSR
jgi:hypothetical protein